MRRRRRDLRWLVPVVVLAAAVVVGVLLVRDAQDHDARPPAPVAGEGGRFTLEADDGVLTFDAEGDRTRLEFEGPNQSGVFGFDEHGAADASGATGTFELTPGEPFGWPESFPLPEGAEVQRGSVVDAGALRQLSATYLVPVGEAEVLFFYEERLAEARPLVEPGEPVDGVAVTHVSFEGDPPGFLTVTAGPFGTVLGVQLMIAPPTERAP